MDENSNDAMGLLQVYGVKIWCLIGESADVRSTRYVLRIHTYYFYNLGHLSGQISTFLILKNKNCGICFSVVFVRITQKCWNSSNSVLSTMVKSNKQGFYF